MKSKIIFGYGSLMSKESLLVTAPNATDIRPAYIQGFIRDFSYWDPLGYTETNLDLAGIPMCSLNVYATSHNTDRVNGVAFSVDQKDYEALLIRERGQRPLSTAVYDYRTGKKIGDCVVFASQECSGSFDFDNPAQVRYLQVALEAARLLGDEFYQEVLTTTYIGKKTLSEFPQLLRASVL